MSCDLVYDDDPITEENKTALFKLIDSSDEIEFCWSIVPDKIKHTSILVRLNGAEFFIDFSRNEKTAFDWLAMRFVYLSAGCQILSPNFKCCCFWNQKVSVKIRKCHRNLQAKIFPAILLLPITESKEKGRAKELVQTLSSIQMGTYNANYNNCRTFVKKAVQILAKQEESCKKEVGLFKEEMSKLEDEIGQKFPGFAVYVVYFFYFFFFLSLYLSS